MNNPKVIADIIREDAELIIEKEEKDSFEALGDFSTHDAEALLKLLERDSLRFQVECDTGASRAFVLDNLPEMRTTLISVHRDDMARAQEILTAWLKPSAESEPKTV